MGPTLAKWHKPSRSQADTNELKELVERNARSLGGIVCIDQEIIRHPLKDCHVAGLFQNSHKSDHPIRRVLDAAVRSGHDMGL
jgi:hypothetical protein